MYIANACMINYGMLEDLTFFKKRHGPGPSPVHLLVLYLRSQLGWYWVRGGVVNKKRIMLLGITSLGLACGGLAMIYNPILDPGNYSS